MPSLLGNIARKENARVHMLQRRCHRRIIKFVGRHIYSLHRGNTAALGRDKPILELGYFALERGLIAEFGRNFAKKCREFRSGLQETKCIIDEKKYVAPL